MSAPIKLSELRAARAATSRDPHEQRGGFWWSQNASALLVTHNAADVLIEFVAARLDLEAAALEAAKVRARVFRVLGKRKLTLAGSAEISEAERPLFAALKRYEAARAKVTL